MHFLKAVTCQLKASYTGMIGLDRRLTLASAMSRMLEISLNLEYTSKC